VEHAVEAPPIKGVVEKVNEGRDLNELGRVQKGLSELMVKPKVQKADISDLVAKI
jgi:hypothetical protein